MSRFLVSRVHSETLRMMLYLHLYTHRAWLFFSNGRPAATGKQIIAALDPPILGSFNSLKSLLESVHGEFGLVLVHLLLEVSQMCRHCRERIFGGRLMLSADSSGSFFRRAPATMLHRQRHDKRLGSMLWL